MHCTEIASISEDMWTQKLHTWHKVTMITIQKLAFCSFKRKTPVLQCQCRSECLYISMHKRQSGEPLSFHSWTHVALDSSHDVKWPLWRRSWHCHCKKIARENKNITTSTKTAGLYPQYFFYVIARKKVWKILVRNCVLLVKAGTPLEILSNVCLITCCISNPRSDFFSWEHDHCLTNISKTIYQKRL